MNIQGTYTNKGLALTAKTAAGACLRVTRVVGGSGHTPDIPNVAQLPEIRGELRFLLAGRCQAAAVEFDALPALFHGLAGFVQATLAALAVFLELALSAQAVAVLAERLAFIKSL